jgi:uncharacterized SAM-binding protein YcdF (DUF218 family)
LESVLVLGKRLLPNGKLPAEFSLQMAEAIRLMRIYPLAIGMITGGVTQPGFPSEAEAAMELVPREMHNRFWLENKSESTRQNVANVKELWEGFHFDVMYVVSSPGHERRTRYLFQKIWPEMAPRLKFDSVGNLTLKDWFMHTILYALTRIDPNEKIFLPLKRKFIERSSAMAETKAQ